MEKRLNLERLNKVKFEDNCAKVYIPVPDVAKEAINIRLRKDELIVNIDPSGKFILEYKQYKIAFYYYMSTEITAAIEKGVLEITIPYKTKYNKNITIKQDTDEC